MDKPSKANIFMLCFIIYSGLLPFVISIFGELGLINTQSDVFEKYLTLFQHLLIFLVPMAVYCLATKTHMRDIVPHDPLSLKNIVLIVFIALFTLPLMMWAGYITEFFVQDTSDIVEDYIEKYSLGFMVAAIGVMPGVFEELMFRGFIMSGYKRLGMVRSVFFSALLFGIMHLNLYQLLYAAAAGIVFGIIVQYTNSIYSSMLAHFIINSIQVVLSKMQDPAAVEAAEEISQMELFVSATVLLAFTLPVLIGILYLFIRINSGRNIDYRYSLSPRREFETDLEGGGGRVIDFPFIIVIIFYVLYMEMLSFFGMM